MNTAQDSKNAKEATIQDLQEYEQDFSSPEAPKEFPVNSNDLDSIKRVLSETDRLTLQYGRVCRQYEADKQRIDAAIRSLSEQQVMLINIMRSKVKAPDTYVLDIDKGSFTKPPTMNNGNIVQNNSRG